MNRHEKKNQYQRKYYENNRDVVKGKMKLYYEKNKERIKLQLKLNKYKKILQKRYMSIIDRYIREYTPFDEEPIQLLEYFSNKKCDGIV